MIRPAIEFDAVREITKYLFLDLVNLLLIKLKLLFWRVKVFVAAWVVQTPVKMTHNHEGYAGHHAYRGNHIVNELTGCTLSHLLF